MVIMRGKSSDKAVEVSIDNEAVKKAVLETEKKSLKEKVYSLAEFFDLKANWGKRELTLSNRPGRSW